MLKHIVLWRFLEHAEGRTKQENIEIIRAGLLALPAVIPEIRSMEIGLDVLHSGMSYDMALIAEFDDMEAMQAYKNHPEHLKVAAIVAKTKSDRATIDFTEQGETK